MKAWVGLLEWEMYWCWYCTRMERERGKVACSGIVGVGICDGGVCGGGGGGGSGGLVDCW